MIILNWSSSYKRAFKKIVKKYPAAKDKILTAMSLLEKDPAHYALKVHKLKGMLEGTLSCYVDYNLRIIFEYVNNPVTGEKEILLIDIGTHEEVY